MASEQNFNQVKSLFRNKKTKQNKNKKNKQKKKKNEKKKISNKHAKSKRMAGTSDGYVQSKFKIVHQNGAGLLTSSNPTIN